jgi:hypothetical protein
MPTMPAMPYAMVAKTAVVAATSIDAIVKIDTRPHIAIRISVVTRIIITRIDNTSAKQCCDSDKKEKFFHNDTSF